jgi:hypothetical protein
MQELLSIDLDALNRIAEIFLSQLNEDRRYSTLFVCIRGVKQGVEGRESENLDDIQPMTAQYPPEMIVQLFCRVDGKVQGRWQCFPPAGDQHEMLQVKAISILAALTISPVARQTRQSYFSTPRLHMPLLFPANQHIYQSAEKR